MNINKEYNDVCALIVTYNRKEYLLNLINAITKQTYSIKKVLIFDNASNDGTSQYLKDNGIIEDFAKNNIKKSKIGDIEILYYLNNNNSGGSGGFNKGIELALKEKTKYIWVMDDDVLPNEDCLEKLVENINEDTKVCIPNRTDNNYTDKAIIELNMSNPFKYRKNRKKYISANSLKSNVTIVKDMPFEGPLFERTIIEKIGLPNKDLFIIFDDTEYAHRILNFTNIAFVKNAVLHKQIILENNKNRLMGWKEYYGYRNQYWFDRKYGKNIFVKKLRPIINTCDLLLRAMVKRKWSNIKIIILSYYDGTHNKLGKTVEPGEDFNYKFN